MTPSNTIHKATRLLTQLAISRHNPPGAAKELGVSISTVQTTRRRLKTDWGKPCEPPKIDEWKELLDVIPMEAIEAYLTGEVTP